MSRNERGSARAVLSGMVAAGILAFALAGPAAAQDDHAGHSHADQSDSADAGAAPEADGSVDVQALMSDQPIPDIVVGDADAPVTIVEYASMTCPHCATFHEETYPEIKERYLDTGKAKLILREFPFDPRSLAAFMLARCTGEDDRRNAMVDVLFEQQMQWARAENASQALLKIARMAGMSTEDFEACLTNEELQQQIVETQERGQNEFDVTATPTFFVNGQKYAGALSAEQLGALIDREIAGSDS